MIPEGTKASEALRPQDMSGSWVPTMELRWNGNVLEQKFKKIDFYGESVWLPVPKAKKDNAKKAV